jgi:hypothetical protein
LFRIADLSRVWILAEVLENEAQCLRPDMFVDVELSIAAPADAVLDSESRMKMAAARFPGISGTGEPAPSGHEHAAHRHRGHQHP